MTPDLWVRDERRLAMTCFRLPSMQSTSVLPEKESALVRQVGPTGVWSVFECAQIAIQITQRPQAPSSSATVQSQPGNQWAG